MTAFDPTRFQFVRLEDFRFPGDVFVYEYKNHPAVDGKRDFLRLNLYLVPQMLSRGADNKLRCDLLPDAAHGTGK